MQLLQEIVNCIVPFFSPPLRIGNGIIRSWRDKVVERSANSLGRDC